MESKIGQINKESSRRGISRFLPLGMALAAFLTFTSPTEAGNSQNPQSPQSPNSCQFVFGAQDIHNRIPDIVGNCIDNQTIAPNGDAQQHTDRGIIYYKKADNLTAFHNSYTTYFIDPQSGSLIDASSYFVNKIDPAFNSDQRTRLVSELSMIVVDAPLIINVNYLSQDTYSGLDTKYPGQIPQAMSKLGSRRFIEQFDNIDIIELGPKDYCSQYSKAGNLPDTCWIFLSNGMGRIVYNPQSFQKPSGFIESVGAKELSGVEIRSATGSDQESEDISYGIELELDKVIFPPNSRDNISMLKDDANHIPGQGKYLAYLNSLPQAA